MLDVGATGRLLLSGELQHVLPLENAKAMRDANPIKNGIWQPDKALTDKRLAEMSRVLRSVGANHDLRPHLLEDNMEYLRITVLSLPFCQ